MYSAPVDQTVFQTVVFAIFCWFVYTFLYKPVVYGHEPCVFTTEDVMRIISTGFTEFYAEREQANLSMNAFSLDVCNSILSMEEKLTAVQRIARKSSFDELDIATTLAGLKYSHVEAETDCEKEKENENLAVGMQREKRDRKCKTK
jgi:hypothetical protein